MVMEWSALIAVVKQRQHFIQQSVVCGFHPAPTRNNVVLTLLIAGYVDMIFCYILHVVVVVVVGVRVSVENFHTQSCSTNLDGMWAKFLQ